MVETREEWAALVLTVAATAQRTSYRCSQCGELYSPAIIEVLDGVTWGVCCCCDNLGNLFGSVGFNPAAYPRWNVCAVAARWERRTAAASTAAVQ